MRRLVHYVIIFWIHLSLGLLFASPVSAQQDSIRFEHLGLEDGLSQSSVSTIIQDDKGFMWFATTGGLNRYDGREMTVYSSNLIEKEGLSDKHVTDICKDPEGNFWITTVNGVTYFNLRTETFSRYFSEDGSNSITHNTAYGVQCDEDGTIWIATNGGLNKLQDRQKGHFKGYYIPEGDSNFRTVYRDSKGVLWVGSFGNGLFYLDAKEQKLVELDLSALSDEVVTSIYEDKNEVLWVGTENGLYRIDKKREQAKAYRNASGDPTSLSDNTVNVIYSDSRSNLWIGTENGLNLYNSKTDDFRRFTSDPTNPNSIKSNRIYSIYEDQHNTLWIGSWSNGIDKFSYHQKGFEHYTHEPNKENTLSDDNIWDFVEDKDKNIWIGTDNGLNRFNPQTGEFLSFFHDPKNQNSLSSNRIFNLAKDQSGNIWMATIKGLNKFNHDTQEFKRYMVDEGTTNSISYPSLWGVDIAADGRVWVTTSGRGVDVLDPETDQFVHYKSDPTDPNSLLDSFTTEVYVDSKDQIWIGTRKGLNLYRPQTDDFKSFASDSTIPKGSSVMDIHEDSKGRLWIGTSVGVFILDSDTHELLNYYNRDDGLPDDIIWVITNDHEGHIYLGTTMGLAVWHPETEAFDIFNKRDGLQANEFNAGAAFTSAVGQVYVGGINGFNKIVPSDLKGNPHAPPVVLTDLQLFNESVPVQGDFKSDNGKKTILQKTITYTDALTLSYADNVISFEFAALNFTIPEKNKYAYKLEGFDEDWNYVGNRNFVTYTELAPGEYTFRVKASNNDGIWNNRGTSLSLIITPPFWQTTWFYLFATVFVIGVIFTGYRMKVRRYKEYSERLEKEVADRTSELNHRNEELKNALEELEKARDEVVEKAHKAGMADLATGILHNVGNILNSVNTSAALIEDTMKHSKLQGLLQANTILRENVDDIEGFVTNNPKGKKLMQYYLRLEDPLKKEQQKVIKQSKRLTEKIELINEAIAAQQSYAGASMYADHISLGEMIEDALTLQAGSIDRHGLTVDKELDSVDPIIAQHSKLMHVLVNLIKNAKEAMAGNRPDDKVIKIRSWEDNDRVFLSISDNGSGIKEENLKKVFNHGFTTKKSGHGFGLHSCANYMKEMGGDIEVESNGKGKGATFTLIFAKAKDSNEEE
ncbi:two-component regulator propeller domain-containing protein [Fodinibius halophilus]|uniref:histidine kinase n=1 Tax=Fodinibius halophilus TaxID=1736908 RepID=A0A6M1SWM4_9BACT|nr:two-component regulator propeller domain-containing protein [Fodinibius halophilus]NGP87956.1 GHKL domain-containing protein [Fodinibius halophilus]